MASLGELLELKATLHDKKDELNAELSGVNKRLDEVDADIVHAMRDSGQTRAANERVSVTMGQKWRAGYDPDKWPAIMEALISSGYGHVVQRRLTDAKVIEMFENGIPLPDGLTLEPFPELSHKRLTAAAK